jgi:hypothetical protein
MYSMLNDEQANTSLTPQGVTLMVYRSLAALSGVGALGVWLAGWGDTTLDMFGNALWVGLSGWLGALICCETMIVSGIVAQSLHLARREIEGRQPFGVPTGLLPDFCDLHSLRQRRRQPFVFWTAAD